MIRIGVHNLYESLNPILFTQRDAPIGDDLLLPLNDLYTHARDRGVTLVPLAEDTDLARLDAILFLDFPDTRSPLARRALMAPKPKHLLTFEPEVIRPENFAEVHHAMFKSVFTWDDDLVESDPSLYVKVNYSCRLPAVPLEDRRTGFAALVASNKHSQHPRELYSQRMLVVRWYDRVVPEALALYGPGWNMHPTWRGVLSPGAKRRTLAKFRFSYCFENAYGFRGYITEKLFDCLLAGVVPIYWGAENVADHVWSSCFIDRRGFNSQESLHRYLVGMSPKEYADYVTAGRQFLASAQALAFDTGTFARTVTDRLLRTA
jgi:hypothetical protein